jgi:hypothetical protein
MAKLPRQYRDSITGLLVDNGMSKADAKAYLKTKPSATQLGNQLSDLYLASLPIKMNDYAAMYGTAIDLFADNGNATQVISLATSNTSKKDKPPKNQGMDGYGDYYNQIYFSEVNGLTYDIYSTQLGVFDNLWDDLWREEHKSTKSNGRQTKPSAREIRFNRYLDIAFEAFVTASQGTAFEDLLGPYYSQVYPQDRQAPVKYLKDPNAYEYYTSELTVKNAPINLPPGGLVFALQELTAYVDQELELSLSQAIYGDVTINFADKPVMNTLYLLGAGANGTQQNQDLIINHEDGSSESYPLTFTDWANNVNTKNKKSPTLSNNTQIGPNEYVLQDFNTYVNNKGKSEGYYRYMFGYAVTVDSTSPVSSIDFNFDDNVKILAASYF